MQHTVRARYRSGHIEAKRIPDYAREKGVDPERKTETFVQITLEVDNDRWQDVPFVLRSGKALGHERKEISIFFEHGQANGIGSLSDGHNILRFKLATEDMNPELINLDGKGEMTQDPMNLGDKMFSQPLPAYGRLFLEAMSGNSALFIRDDEVEEMWKVIQPIADAWADNVVPLLIYRAGSDGPVIGERTGKRGHESEPIYGSQR